MPGHSLLKRDGMLWFLSLENTSVGIRCQRAIFRSRDLPPLNLNHHNSALPDQENSSTTDRQELMVRRCHGLDRVVSHLNASATGWVNSRFPPGEAQIFPHPCPATQDAFRLLSDVSLGSMPPVGADAFRSGWLAACRRRVPEFSGRSRASIPVAWVPGGDSGQAQHPVHHSRRRRD